jgi:hypothetical protein
MIELDNRKITDNGQVVCSDQAIEQLIYRGHNLEGIIADNSIDVRLFNQINRLFDMPYNSIKIYDLSEDLPIKWFSDWFTPEPYSNLDIEVWLINKCKTSDEQLRCVEELVLYQERNMYPILKYLLYMVEMFRKNKVLWGVGRGSSVSSFVLYLIGINRINPMLFNLDIKEFLR